MDAEKQITKEEISMTGFSIVAYSGDARTYLMQAMDKASEGKITEAKELVKKAEESINFCLLYTSPSPRDRQKSRMPSSA